MSDTVKIDSLFQEPSTAGGAKVKIDELFADPTVPKPLENERQLVKDIGANLGKQAAGAASNIAAFADMILSLPGQALGVGGDMGMRVRAAAAGIDRRTAAQMGQRFAHEVSDPLSNPLRKLMGLFGYGDT